MAQLPQGMLPSDCPEFPERPSTEPKLRWPYGTTALTVIILASSFCNWGTIDHQYFTNPKDIRRISHRSEQAMFPPNVVMSKDPTKGRIVREIPASGTAWRSGLLFAGSIIPHWIVVVLIPICLAFRLFEKLCFPIHSYYIRWPLCAYGCFHVFSSFMAFGTTGRPGAGLWLAIFCYSGLALSCLVEWPRLGVEYPKSYGNQRLIG